MTLKEAILLSLEELRRQVNSLEVCNYILEKKYYSFGGKTPAATISAQLGEFIRNGDNRIKRNKKESGTFYYYLSTNETQLDDMNIETEVVKTSKNFSKKNINYYERDLHILLSSYLKNTGVYSKTIFHENSNGKDKNQTWIHPDMVGIKFLSLKSKESKNFINSISRTDTFKISSYELKREINTDSELKEAFFQAVSNSSWANYGYLVAFEFSDSLLEEIERLNQSFGIGIIELNSNPFQSKTLFQAKLKHIDFKTIDKICHVNNKDFGLFIEQIEKLMTADERYLAAIEKEFSDICDPYFGINSDSEIEKYCSEKHIPQDSE